MIHRDSGVAQTVTPDWEASSPGGLPETQVVPVQGEDHGQHVTMSCMEM